MDRNHHSTHGKRERRALRALGTFSVLLALPLVAFALLGSWSAFGAQPSTELAAADDPLANGLLILDPPPLARLGRAGSAQPGGEDDATVVQLKNWTYTDYGGSARR